MTLIQNQFNLKGVQNIGKQKSVSFCGVKNNSLSSDVVSFKGRAEDKDWKKLVPLLNFSIKKNNYLGGGAEADVYKINDKYVLRLFGGTKFVMPQTFTPQLDIFQGRNFGQPVAISRDGKVSINKLVSGHSLYNVNGSDEKVYMQ
ncbi:hypothetical protein J6Q66_05640, partial [bacterium]|nr:hypothetical protein [bacterium]